MQSRWWIAGLVVLAGCWPVIPGKWADYRDTGSTDTGTTDTGTDTSTDTGTDTNTDTGSCDTSYEPNDVESGARTVTSGQVVHAAVCPSGDADWYRLELTAGCSATVTLSFTSVNGDLDLFLYDAGSLVTSSEGTGNTEQFSWGTEITTAYDIEVIGYQGAQNPYTLSFAVSCTGDTGTSDTGTTDTGTTDTGLSCVDDDFEPNDIQGDAYQMFAGQSIDGAVCHTASPDWFTVPIPRYCALDATLDFVDANGDLDLYAYWNATEVGSSAGVTDHEEVHWMAPEDADADVEVKPYPSSATENAYSLSLFSDCSDMNASCPADDSREDDDIPGDATLVYPGDAVAGVTCDDDWVKIAAASTTCIVHAHVDSLDASPVAAAIGDGYGRIAESAPGGVGGADVQALASDQAWVQVTGDTGSHYGLTSDITGCQTSSPSCTDDDAFEPNDDSSAGFPTLPGAYIHGVICGNDDWFRVPGTNGCTLTASASWSSSAGNLGVSILDANGSTVAYTAGTSGVAVATGTLDQFNPVAVGVQLLDGTEVPYTLSLTLACGR